MASNSESDNENSTPPEIVEAAQSTYRNLLPEKSKNKYNTVYKNFKNWQTQKNTNSFSENVLLAYFGELTTKNKSSSLWAHYSMLRSTLILNNNVNIKTYSKLRALLKRKSKGYEPKTFTPDEINKFINEADDNIFLATKYTNDNVQFSLNNTTTEDESWVTVQFAYILYGLLRWLSRWYISVIFKSDHVFDLEVFYGEGLVPNKRSKALELYFLYNVNESRNRYTPPEVCVTCVEGVF